MPTAPKKLAIADLKEKASWVWKETLKIHKKAPETRVASSLSDIEIFVALYYGGILKFNPENPFDEERDRFIISKGHGSISMYPILADLGFYPLSDLETVCERGSKLGAIPDPVIPGYETINGSLGHGLGVASGMAVGLKRKGSSNHVFVLVGDGELYEGANWEAILFAAHNKLDNLTLIVDHNRISMLDYCEKIINISPLEKRFEAFDWKTSIVDGHELKDLVKVLSETVGTGDGQPHVVIANTVKGKGVPKLENQSLSHIMSLKSEEVDKLLEEKG